MNKLVFVGLLFLCLFACKQNNNQNLGRTIVDDYQLNNVHSVVSDDSVITVRWWYTGEGGTADDIESECTFVAENGKMIKECRPLLNIAHPNDEYGHHQVERIMTYEGEYDQKAYLFFLRAKVGSNEFAHNIIAMQIDGDSLCPAKIFDINKSDSCDIDICVFQ